MMTTAEAETIGTGPRTRYQAMLDVRIGMRVDELNMRFYRHVSSALKFITVCGGSGAFLAFVSKNGELAAWLGLVLAIVAVIEVVASPAERAACFDASRRRFGELRTEAPRLGMDELRTRLASLQADDIPGTFAAFSALAYNDVMVENNEPDRVPTGKWQRVMAVLA